MITENNSKSKYNTVWTTYLGKKLMLEEMTTNHLLNAYKNIENNYQEFVNGAVEPFPKTVTNDFYKVAEGKVKIAMLEMKVELLSRGVTLQEIENHVEEIWKIKGVVNAWDIS